MKGNWWENIPENGVLCKNIYHHRHVFLIKSYGGKINNKEIVIDGCGDEVLLDAILPLSAAEWWQFAPWQDMDSAPRDNSHMLLAGKLDENGEFLIKIGGFDTQKQEWVLFGASWKPLKWLPLPTGYL